MRCHARRRTGSTGGVAHRGEEIGGGAARRGGAPMTRTGGGQSGELCLAEGLLLGLLMREKRQRGRRSMGRRFGENRGSWWLTVDEEKHRQGGLHGGH
jgi:hypothetical protein